MLACQQPCSFCAYRSSPQHDMASRAPLVLVTGATGFLGSHCVWLLLHSGYRVRGTTRNLHQPKAGELVAAVASLQLEGWFELVACNLAEVGGWADAASGAQFCIHTASPSHRIGVIDTSHIVSSAVLGARFVLKVGAIALQSTSSSLPAPLCIPS
jgi:dihydroflavonol-4-reductase